MAATIAPPAPPTPAPAPEAITTAGAHADFGRIHGSGSSDGMGGLQFASGAHLVQTYDESGPGPLQFDRAADGRVAAYQGYAKGNVLDQGAMAMVVQTPLNDQILQTFGNPHRQLPGDELGGVVSYFSAGTLGPEAAAAMGLAEGTMSYAVVSAAVAGAITSTVSGAISGNLSLKGILQGAT